MPLLRLLNLIAAGTLGLGMAAIASPTVAAQSHHSPTAPTATVEVADLFKTLRIIEDVDDLLEGDYLEVSPIEDVLDPINDAIEVVDNTVDEVQDIFDDDSRDAIDDIDNAIDRATYDAYDWYD